MKPVSGSSSLIGPRRFAPRTSTASSPTTLRTSSASISRRPCNTRGETLRKSLAEWFRTFHGPIGYEVHDLSITAGDEVAFCRSLNRISGTRTGGEETDVWVRVTIGWRSVGGRWLIAHEHASVPFYMDGSARAAIDLKP
jgi:PhnB protein